MLAEGSRRQVYNGTAKRTSGGLTRKDLIKNKFDRIVSAKKSRTAKKENRLVKHGYGSKKGHFGWVKVDKKHHKKSHKKSAKRHHKKSGKKHHKK